MPSNSTLITSASQVALASNGTDNVIVGTDGANAYVVGAGAVGDDTISNFGKNDSLLTKTKIYDGNGDGIITFGDNDVLDVDRTSDSNAGADQLTLGGIEGSSGIRYLGAKGGYYVYADATVRLAGFTEGTVSNNTLQGTAGVDKFFYDTALGLNLGLDTIVNFGAEDKIVTTVALYDSNGDGLVEYGSNHLFDLPGSTGPAATDQEKHLGGQLSITDTDGHEVTGLYFDSSEVVNGVTYYYYSLESSELPPA